MPIELERTEANIILSALNRCTHKKNIEISPIWSTEGNIQFATVHCTECDTFLGFITRKTPKYVLGSLATTDSTVKLHQLINLHLELRKKTDKDHGELKP